ncbi:hypothetical protein NAT51_07570 [Flavobacterium amniphilum]|uniref:hypothetical protein n=1 Tax=Flavobacterium amniphilum TaxID=1834035 RepID=UPI00202A624B|nr:hypothetical protein [Flavobacterium amniphilum]MCL9805375.1 hypothetical protein [Flavobacterium amniphilum]
MYKHNKWSSNFSFQESILERKSIVLKIVTVIKWEANRLFATNQKIYSELEIEFANIRV